MLIGQDFLVLETPERWMVVFNVSHPRSLAKARPIRIYPMRVAMPIVALFLILFLPVCLIGCFGDTGTIQEQLPRYSDMGAAADAGRVK
jgi:hypothetical protein